jgi:hypothetical protein
MAESNVDFEALAAGVEQMREAVRAMVAGLVADGFTDEQARDIVAGIWRSTGRNTEEDED